MKATEAMIAAGGAKLSEFENVEYTDARPAPTYDALAEQLFDVMMAACEADSGDVAPMVDPFDWSEAGLAAIDAYKMQHQLRDNLLDVMRTMPNVWQKLTEAQQRSLAKRCHEFSAKVVYQAAHAVAGLGHKSMGALLKEVKFGEKGTDVKIAAIDDVNAADPLALDFELVRFQGKNVVIVFVDPATYNEDATDAKIDAQEPPLPMGEAHPAQAKVDVVAAGETEKELVEPDADPAPTEAEQVADARGPVEGRQMENTGKRKAKAAADA